MARKSTQPEIASLQNSSAESADVAGEYLNKSSQDLEREARLAMDQLFPPNLDLAEQSLLKALSKKPLSSSLWLDLARVRLFQNNPEQVREALQLSETFDPGFSEQRIRSIPILIYLGESETAKNTGFTILKQAPQFTARVLTALFAGGVPYAELNQYLNLETTPSSDYVEIAKAFRLANIQERTLFFEALMKVEIADIELLDLLAAEAVRQQLFHVSRKLLNENSVGNITIQELILVDPEATEDVPYPRRTFGWLQVPQQLTAGHTHLSTYGGAFGVHQFEVISTLKSTDAVQHQWNAYRFIRKSSQVETQLNIRILIQDPELVSVQFKALDFSTNQTITNMTSIKGEAKEWQVYEVRLQPSPFDQIITLVLVFKAKGSPLKNSSFVYVDGITLPADSLSNETEF